MDSDTYDDASDTDCDGSIRINSRQTLSGSQVSYKCVFGGYDLNMIIYDFQGIRVGRT